VTLGQRAVASRTIRSRRVAAADVRADPAIGGKTGWYYANGFWRLRGLMDKLVGGVGLRRGRRDPVRLAVGDTLDFWRVEAFEQDRLLRLSAEMKTPGRIWLQFEVDGDQAGTTLRQTAIFDPHGLAGLAYWYALYPVHYLIFEGMLRRIDRLRSRVRERVRPPARRRRPHSSTGLGNDLQGRAIARCMRTRQVQLDVGRPLVAPESIRFPAGL
jgi:hypothetical protein